MSDKIINKFNEVLITGIIFIDLQKPFDSTNHQILLKKIHFIDFSNQCRRQFWLYLSGQIFLKWRTKTQITEKILCCISQGSVLGPLIFLICVNDMPQAVNQINFYLQMTPVSSTNRDISKKRK